jgi:phage shock protein A
MLFIQGMTCWKALGWGMCAALGYNLFHSVLYRKLSFTEETEAIQYIRETPAEIKKIKRNIDNIESRVRLLEKKYNSKNH